MTEPLPFEALTLDEFFAQLARTPRDWYLDADGAIRRRNPAKDPGVECPVGALSETWGLNAVGAALDLGMAEDDAWVIADSSDNQTAFDFDPVLRARLLAACGLEERP